MIKSRQCTVGQAIECGETLEGTFFESLGSEGRDCP
jgi:hypothetical protein